MYIKITDNKIIYPEINMDIVLDEIEYKQYLTDNGFINIPEYELEYIKFKLETLNNNAYV
jgi:hypothetical protein